MSVGIETRRVNKHAELSMISKEESDSPPSKVKLEGTRPGLDFAPIREARPRRTLLNLVPFESPVPEPTVQKDREGTMQ